MTETVAMNLSIPLQWNQARKRLHAKWRQVIREGLIAINKQREAEMFWRMERAKAKT